MLEKMKTGLLIVLTIGLVISIIAIFGLNKELNNSTEIGATKDAIIQEMNTKLGLAQSTLESSKQLNENYKSEIDQFPTEIKKIVDKNQLELRSRDETIAKLKNSVSGGTTTVVVNTPPSATNQGSISYEWSDKLSRFKLTDPDIFTKDNEKFEYNQNFRVIGQILSNKDGKFQLRHMELQEVVPDGTVVDGKINYKPVDGGKLSIVDSKFEFTPPPPPAKTLSDLFTLRILAIYDSQLDPGIGLEVINGKKLLNYANFGLNVSNAFNLTDPLHGSLQKSRIGIGIDYQLVPPLVDSNFGIGLTVSTPYNNLINQWYLTIDGIFFLTN